MSQIITDPPLAFTILLELEWESLGGCPPSVALVVLSSRCCHPVVDAVMADRRTLSVMAALVDFDKSKVGCPPFVGWLALLAPESSGSCLPVLPRRCELSVGAGGCCPRLPGSFQLLLWLIRFVCNNTVLADNANGNASDE